MCLVLGDAIATGRDMQDLEQILGGDSVGGDSDGGDSDGGNDEAHHDTVVNCDNETLSTSPASPTTELQKSSRRAALLSKLKSNSRKRMRDGVDEVERQQRQEATRAIVGMETSLRLLVEVMAASKGLSHMVQDEAGTNDQQQRFV
jgi:hypothetical protein